MNQPFIPAPVFIEHQGDGEASSVRCPRCKDLYVHVEEGMVRISGVEDYPEGGGGFRGPYIVVPFSCENCGDLYDDEKGHESGPGFEVFFQFHKGQTFMWATVLRPPLNPNGGVS